MANRSSFAALSTDNPRRHLSVDAPPSPLPRDVPGSDNPIPLSPQWLLPKPVDNKQGILSGEPKANRLDAFKAPGVSDDPHDSAKRKDVFRPSSFELDSGRYDRWRDEERETHPVRRDRWRESDKETHKTERWSDRHTNNNANRDGNHESKWNKRWGPDDKESENRSDKWPDSGRSYDGSRDRSSAQAKDTEKEGDGSRSWKSNSYLARGSQPMTPNKHPSTLAYGRGKGEGSTFSAGHGKADNNTGILNNGGPRSYPTGFLSKRLDNAQGDTALRYSRIKLLDVFRLTNIKSVKLSMEEFTDVPSLTIGEPLEPIALSAPTSEEMVIIKGIEKGDIISSGLPQASKDGANVNNFTDSDGLSQSRLGSRENLSVGDSEISDNTKVHKKLDDASEKEVGIMAKSPSQTTPWRSPSLAERTQGSYKRPDIVRSHLTKNPEMEMQYNDRHLDQKNDPKIRRQSFEVLEQERKSTVFHNSTSNRSPEELNFYYKDPQGQIQGPFAGIDLIGWFENGYFGIDLQVRVADAPPDAPFSLLGDVMPHLRSKRPPPGFVSTTSNEAADLASRGVFGNAHPVLREVDAVTKIQRFLPGGEGEAEKRFIESLMSGNVNSPLPEHYSLAEATKAVSGSSLNAGNSPDINNLLAQRLSLERQRSVSTVHPFVRDMSLIGPKPEAVPEPQSKFLPQSSPQVDFLSMLQAATADKPSSTSTVNNNLAMWPNLNVAPTLNNANQPIVSQTGFGGQLPNLHSQLLGQPEKLLAPEITQDPQLLNLLQQQFLMSQLQMQSQPPVPSQLSLLEKYLLLKQQQQQQEQQMLIQQQQHMLSQVLSNQQVNQHFNEPSFGQISPAHLDALRNNMQPQSVGAVSAHAVSRPIDVGIEAPRELNSGPVAYLPHQMFENALPPVNKNSSQHSDLESTQAVINNSVSLNPEEKPDKKPFFLEQDVATNAEITAVQDGSSAVVSESGKTSDFITSPSEVIGSVKSFDESVPKSAPAKEVKAVDVKETKKTSDKKSRKQKNPKAQPTSDMDSNKATSTPQVKPADIKEETNDASESLNSVHADVPLSTKMRTNTEETPSVNLQSTSSHRAWKPSPGLRPKSLLEIQQEEQKRLQSQAVVSETPAAAAPAITSKTPWSGIVAVSDNQPLADDFQTVAAQPSFGSSKISSTAQKNRKSPLHDLLAEEVLAHSKEENIDEYNSSLPPLPHESAEADIPFVDDDFVEAKDTKKSRKKAAKAAKVAGVKASPPVAASYLSAPSVPKEKSKNTRQIQLDKEVLPAPPAGPSLGDFVPWKGDQTNPAPAAAWSNVDSSKPKKPTSLRDILKEQEKKSSSNPSAPQLQIPVPNASTKSQSNRGNRGSGSSWPVAGSSPTNTASSPSQMKAASPGRASLASSQSKPKVEDDSFWGTLDQSKQETKQSSFPSLSNSHSSGGKSSTKNAVGASSAQQKANVSRSSSKERKGSSSKQSEAMDFRDWCESELVKLTGTKDTSFLEYCLRQSTSEAEMLLRENLGSVDFNHQFIDKFLDYKDFLSNDVIEMAFGVQAVQKATGIKVASKESKGSKDNEIEGGGKKKGKKGKKVNPAVLGFNIVSNRIMMGEIQTVDD